MDTREAIERLRNVVKEQDWRRETLVSGSVLALLDVATAVENIACRCGLPLCPTREIEQSLAAFIAAVEKDVL